MNHAGPDDITRELTIRTLRPGGVLKCTTIHPITEQDATEYQSLGSVSATDLGMLLLMARKHCPGFVENVAAYRVIALPEGVELPAGPDQTLTTIEFFERSAR